MLLLLPSTSRTGILKTNMVHPRKRQRQTAEPCCSSSSESENGDAAALSSSCDEEEQCPLKQQSSSSSSASPVMLPVLIRQQNQRKRTRRRRLLPYSSSNRRRYSSWTSLATLLLWLCGSSDASWGSGNRTTTKKGLLNVAKSCRKEEIVVQAAYMVCDSPGAYYRGSGTYRDSTTCVYGDKARLQLVFLITKSFTGASSIRLEIEAGLYDQWKRVAIMDDLCGYSGSNLQRIYSEDDTTYSTTSCPNPGLYQLDTYFIVPGFTQDQELHYTPDIRFRLYSARGRVLGCATTGTYAQGHMARQHAKDGLFALSVAFCVLCCVFSTLIYLNYGRERRLLAEKLKQRKQQQLLERANDNDCAGSTHLEPMVHTTKMAAAAGEANHDHDHAQRYHYFEPPDEAEFNGSSNASQTSNGESSSIDTRNYPRRI